jgi:type I restriction enzyme R subunit
VSGATGPDNFGFVAAYDTHVVRLARQAESYVHSDPDSSLFKLRLMIETMTRQLVRMQMPQHADADLSRMLQALERSGTLPRRHADAMHAIRRDGNAAVHGTPMPVPTAMRRLRDAHVISGWYCRMIRRGAKPVVPDFRAPERPTPPGARARAALERAEALEEQIERQRRRGRDSLMLFGDPSERDAEVARLRAELEALDHVAAAAGEPLIDAESIAVVMAMELERLLGHPRLGLTAQQAQHEAEAQYDAVLRHFDEREAHFCEERARLAEAARSDSEGE